MNTTDMIDLDDQIVLDKYAEFIMNNSAGDRFICNGDDLLDAMEDQYLFEEFCASVGVVV